MPWSSGSRRNTVPATAAVEGAALICAFWSSLWRPRQPNESETNNAKRISLDFTGRSKARAAATSERKVFWLSDRRHAAIEYRLCNHHQNGWRQRGSAANEPFTL